MKIAILMATYNGEKYIKEQLDSILNQSFKNWSLYISDDISSDNTLNILKEYKKKDSRIKQIWTNKEMHGAFSNFFNVIRNTKKLEEDFDYYLYCDQDDIWLKDKIKLLVEFINYKEKIYPQLPIAVYSDLELINPNGISTKTKMSDIRDLSPKNQYEMMFKGAYVWGTAMIFNKKLWTMLNVSHNMSNDMPHDIYTSFYACSFGKIFYYDKPLVLYRRHATNVSHLPQKITFIKAIQQFVKNISSTINWNAEKIWRISYFLNVSEKSNKFTIDMSKALNAGGIKAIKFLRKYNITPANSIYSVILFKTIVISKIYKHTKWYLEVKK